MVLSLEESKKIKDNLLARLGSFPEEKREEIKEKVESMPVSEVEEFVKDNKLTHLGNQCIFCSIVAGGMPSFKIAEDGNNIAILEINPLSRGHTLIVPKSHVQKADSSSEALAKEVGKLLSSKFSPKEVHIQNTEIMGHGVLEVVPLYGGEKERHSASEEELKSIQSELLSVPEPVIINSEPKEDPELAELDSSLYRLPPRIP